MNRSGLTGKKVVLWALRLALSGLFIYAGVAKLRAPHAFSESIDSFRLLPPALISPATLSLPPLEILAGILALLGGRMRRAGAFSLLGMLTIFLVALAQAQARGLNVDCGCFGADKFDVLSPTKNLWVTMARDVVLAVAAWSLYAEAKNQHSVTIKTFSPPASSL